MKAKYYAQTQHCEIEPKWLRDGDEADDGDEDGDGDDRTATTGEDTDDDEKRRR